MIGTIVIGRGNNRVVVERERNFRMSQWAADGIKRRLGILDTSNPRRWRNRGNVNVNRSTAGA